MPDAQQYRDAAARFRALATHVAVHGSQVARWPIDGHLAPGPAADALAGGLARSAAQLAAAGEHLASLAATCERRALICEEYERVLAEHRRQRPFVHPFLPEPAPPYRWVSA